MADKKRSGVAVGIAIVAAVAVVGAVLFLAIGQSKKPANDVNEVGPDIVQVQPAGRGQPMAVAVPVDLGAPR
jgi:hypothetical protein